VTVLTRLRGDLRRRTPVSVASSNITPTPTVVTDIAIYPFVGLIARPPAWTIAVDEVQAVLEAPLGEIAATHRLETFQRPRGPVTTDAYTLAGETIWGATGRILADLLERLDGDGA